MNHRLINISLIVLSFIWGSVFFFFLFIMSNEWVRYCVIGALMALIYTLHIIKTDKLESKITELEERLSNLEPKMPKEKVGMFFDNGAGFIEIDHSEEIKQMTMKKKWWQS